MTINLHGCSSWNELFTCLETMPPMPEGDGFGLFQPSEGSGEKRILALWHERDGFRYIADSIDHAKDGFGARVGTKPCLITLVDAAGVLVELALHEAGRVRGDREPDIRDDVSRLIQLCKEIAEKDGMRLLYGVEHTFLDLGAESEGVYAEIGTAIDHVLAARRLMTTRGEQEAPDAFYKLVPVFLREELPDHLRNAA